MRPNSFRPFVARDTVFARLSSLWRTSSFRLTLFYAGLFSASALLLFGLVSLTANTFLSRQIDGTIADELAEVLADIAGTGSTGAQSVVAGLTERAPGMYYLLEDKDMHVLAGNLRPITPVLGFQSLPGTVQDDRSRRGGIRGKGVWLADGSYLFVGLNDLELRELHEALARASLAGLMGTLLLAVLGGIATSTNVLHRIDAVSRISRDIMAGDLGRRVPLRGTEDEFDHLAASLNAMLDRIQELMAGIQQVSNDIAHDLRTPLTRLRQRLELALRREHDAEGLRAALERSIGDVDAILDTFGALLRIAQVEAGSRRAGFKQVDLSGLLGELLEAYGPVADERGQRLDGDIGPGLTTSGDHDLLTQLFANLIENAIRHSQPGARIGVRAQAAGNELVICVTDNGPGIPVSERKNVLRRFHRLEASRSTPGSGLGLSLVQAVATLHEATLGLDDNDPGLRCVIRLSKPQPM